MKENKTVGSVLHVREGRYTHKILVCKLVMNRALGKRKKHRLDRFKMDLNE
jgi:hypothetical protein